MARSKKGASPNKNNLADLNQEYIWSMKLAPKPGSDVHWVQMLLICIFTSAVIGIVYLHIYEVDSSQYFWSAQEGETWDFFSYSKMCGILACAFTAVLCFLYRAITQSLYIKRSFAYVPIAVYALFVLLSYVFSDYKNESLLGFRGRFEGTLVILAYMVMLCFIINTIQNEANIKFIITFAGAASCILGVIGITQAVGHDFFKTRLGIYATTPPRLWNNETFESLSSGETLKVIYQTLYNINYVSFYLTLLIPLFGLLFIRSVMLKSEEKNWKKAAYGVVFSLLMFNLFGSASSGGILGMFMVVLLGIILFNKKIWSWKVPLAVLIVLTLLMAVLSYDKILPEMQQALDTTLNSGTQQSQGSDVNGRTGAEGGGPASKKPVIDYFHTTETHVETSINGNPLFITADRNNKGQFDGVILTDEDGKNIPITMFDEDDYYFSIDDDRFYEYCAISSAFGTDSYYVILKTGDQEWNFSLNRRGFRYFADTQKLVDLEPVPYIGWENNPDFGSGRGYIWSRTLPLLKDNILLGTGADAFVFAFPNHDYAGKYSADWENINLIVDKPHNMYLGIFVTTGGISLAALLVLFGFYICQSFRLYFRRTYENHYLSFAGAGIFLGICGFLTAGLVNDTSVSVMPIFYGLLGTGIAANMILKRSLQ